MKPVRRVLVTAEAFGSVLGFAVDLARGLCASGIEVILAIVGGSLRRDPPDEVEAIDRLVVERGDFRVEWMDEPWADVDRAAGWLLNLERRYAPDIVHLNGYSHGALPFAAPVLITAHSCVTSWWRSVKGQEPPARYQEYRRRVGRGLSAAEAVVAPTYAMLRALVGAYGPLARAQVIPSGIWHDRWRPAPKESFILAAGRLWDRAKNLVALAEVAPRLPWPVRVAGETVSSDGRGGRIGSIEAIGRIDRSAVGDWMARAAVFAHPARYEPFGVAPLEAAAAGCALVLGDIPSLREVWGNAATYVDPSSLRDLEQALLGLIADAPHRAKMAARARRRAKRYSALDTRAAYLTLYDKLSTVRSLRRIASSR